MSDLGVQETLDGKKIFKFNGERTKPKILESEEQKEERLREWEKWITQKKPYGQVE